MSKTYNIMAIQMSSVLGEKEKNIKKAEQLINDNVTSDIDVVILPEVWTVGWACEFFKNSAEDLNNSNVIKFLSKMAKMHNVNIIGGSFITKQGEKLFNTCPVLNRNGELIGTYNKCHLYNYYGDIEGELITSGENPVIVTLDGLRTGLSICYDIRFPELYRSYALKGVDLMVNTAAWGIKKEIPWVSMTRSRAVENQCYFVALTQSGAISNGYNLGKSEIIDYKGDTLAKITEGEGAISATINLDEEYDFRSKCTVFKDIHENYNVKEI